MVHCNIDDLYRPRYVALWMILAMKSGYLNALGFLATGKFVSHVTGFGTQVGISLAHDDYVFGIELLILPLAFIIGSSVPAWVLERNYESNKIPKYYLVQITITIFLGILLYFGVKGKLGDFSTRLEDFNHIVLIGGLSFICGMKNGLTTWASHGKIRTTHLTGLATDIGLHLPKLFRGAGPSRFPEKRKINSVRMLTFISFSTGSLIAAFILPELNFYGLIIPFVLSVILSCVSCLNFKYHSDKKKFSVGGMRQTTRP